MRYPEFLKKGGTIGFVAPSFGCATEPYKTAFQNAQKKFRKQGFALDLGPNCYEAKGIGISNTPKLCGEELTDYYCSDQNDVLISCGGGELMCEDLDYVDFDRIRQAKPKWYMGYSDNTNFTFLLTTLCDVASVYGPCAAAFGMEPWHPSLKDAVSLLCGEKQTMTGYEMWERESLKDEEHPLLPYNVTEPRKLRCYIPEEEKTKADGLETERFSVTGKNIQMKGRLIGGCMDCLVNLLGTSYDQVSAFAERYQSDGFIWYLESCDLNVFSIRRAVWQMVHAGWFAHVKGFLIGRPYVHGQELMGLDQYHAVCDLLKQYGVPIVMDVDLGHLAPMMPLVNGSIAEVKVNGNDIQIQMELESEKSKKTSACKPVQGK